MDRMKQLTTSLTSPSPADPEVRLFNHESIPAHLKRQQVFSDCPVASVSRLNKDSKSFMPPSLAKVPSISVTTDGTCHSTATNSSFELRGPIQPSTACTLRFSDFFRDEYCASLFFSIVNMTQRSTAVPRDVMIGSQSLRMIPTIHKEEAYRTLKFKSRTNR